MENIPPKRPPETERSSDGWKLNVFAEHADAQTPAAAGDKVCSRKNFGCILKRVGSNKREKNESPPCMAIAVFSGGSDLSLSLRNCASDAVLATRKNHHRG